RPARAARHGDPRTATAAQLDAAGLDRGRAGRRATLAGGAGARVRGEPPAVRGGGARAAGGRDVPGGGRRAEPGAAKTCTLGRRRRARGAMTAAAPQARLDERGKLMPKFQQAAWRVLPLAVAAMIAVGCESK